MRHRDSLNTLRLQRGVEHLHQLGARATAEALAEVADRIGGWPCLLSVLTEYERRLTPSMIEAARADRFPPRPSRCGTMSAGIALPAGVDIRLCIVAPYHLVLVSPPGTKAEPEMMVRPGGVAGLFTHDPGLTWPDREGCRAATEYLANGCPICLQFVALADAIACHRRLKAETVR